MTDIAAEIARFNRNVNAMTKTLKSTWIARCPACKAHRRLERGETVDIWGGRPAPHCACGRTMTARLLRGHVSPDHKCGARCLASKGHVCECSCGGANHGTAA